MAASCDLKAIVNKNNVEKERPSCLATDNHNFICLIVIAQNKLKESATPCVHFILVLVRNIIGHLTRNLVLYSKKLSRLLKSYWRMFLGFLTQPPIKGT